MNRLSVPIGLSTKFSMKERFGWAIFIDYFWLISEDSINMMMRILLQESGLTPVIKHDIVLSEK